MIVHSALQNPVVSASYGWTIPAFSPYWYRVPEGNPDSVKVVFRDLGTSDLLPSSVVHSGVAWNSRFNRAEFPLDPDAVKELEVRLGKSSYYYGDRGIPPKATAEEFVEGFNRLGMVSYFSLWSWFGSDQLGLVCRCGGDLYVALVSGYPLRDLGTISLRLLDNAAQFGRVLLPLSTS